MKAQSAPPMKTIGISAQGTCQPLLIIPALSDLVCATALLVFTAGAARARLVAADLRRAPGFDQRLHRQAVPERVSHPNQLRQVADDADARVLVQRHQILVASLQLLL